MHSKEIDSAYFEMMERISKIFSSEPGLRTAKKYMQGLLSPIERKNGWQMAEAVGETTPYVMQQFLYRGQFSADDLRNELRGYVSEKLGDEDGVLVVDETWFLKQGKNVLRSEAAIQRDSRADRELSNRGIFDICE